MFRENNDHLQQSFVTSISFMDASVQKKLMESWAAVFYHLVFCQIDEKLFSVLYDSSNGRPNFPINILLSLEYIKHMFNYSDEELIEQFYFNYQISYALGIKNVGETNLSPGTLYEFRRRLYEYAATNPKECDLAFTQFIALTKNFAEKADISVDEQRMDSTMISANIKNAGRLALVYDVLVQGIKALPENLLVEPLKEVLVEGYKNRLLYKCKTNQVVSKLQEMLDKCVMVSELAKNNVELQQSQGIRVLERFLNEQTDVAKDTQKRIAKDNKDIKASSLQSAYDEDATFRQKAKKTGKGYTVNIAETTGKNNDFQLITDYSTKANIISDTEFAEERLPILKSNFDVKDAYVDGGFFSSKVEETAEANEIVMHYTDMTGKKPDEGSVKINEFELNTDNTVSNCPKGIEPKSTSFDVEKETIVAHFSKEICSNCELKDKCCVHEQKKSNKFSTTVEAIEIQNKRDEIKLNIKENSSKRVAIEGTNSELKRAHGLDSVKVLGLVKVAITTGLKITACNIKRFTKNAIQKLRKLAISRSCTQDKGIILQN